MQIFIWNREQQQTRVIVQCAFSLSTRATLTEPQRKRRGYFRPAWASSAACTLNVSDHAFEDNHVI